MTTTQDIINDILAREGRYVNNPDDKGGPTNYGITLAELRAFRHDSTLTANDVQKLTRTEAEQIYLTDFVSKPGFTQIHDDQVRAFMVDWGVNSGPATAIKHLQAILLPDEKPDGILGPKTAALTNAADPADLLSQLIEDRLAFVKHDADENPSQQQFLAGWITRIESFKNG